MTNWEWTPERLQAAQHHYPNTRSAPPAGTFEIALSCAGATSTAAYTAGVLDFMFQALDEWERLKKEKPASVPHHVVLVRAFVGTSGGGMSLAIAAANAARDFAPVSHDDVALAMDPKRRNQRRAREAMARLQANPLFATWVLGIDLFEGMDPLTGDSTPGLAAPWAATRSADKFPSLLNCEIIETLAKSAVIVGKPGLQGAPKARAWLADPLELRLTVTNLNGVAFNVSFGGARLAQTFLAARDEMAFAVETGGTRPFDLAQYKSAKDACPPDCRFLDCDVDRTGGAWGQLSLAAMATGALPVALEMRSLSAPRDFYIWRTVRFEGEGDPTYLMPHWPEPGEYNDFVASDGGFTHDPPFEYARQRLAGTQGRNPRDGASANRAMILIDPLLGTERNRDTSKLMSALFSMLMAPVEQSRLDASQLFAAADERVYSRFMITPRRTHPLDPKLTKLDGSFALVASGVHAFLGFASSAYRAHDFLLGRRNAQKFFKDSFAVPEGNPILSVGGWTDAHKKEFRAEGDVPHYQIVPLCGAAKGALETPDWPSGAVSLKSKTWKNGMKELRARIKSVSASFAQEIGEGPQNLARAIAPMVMDRLVATAMIKQLEDGVTRVNSDLPAIDEGSHGEA